MAFFTSLEVRGDMGADSERRYCGVVRVVTGISSLLLLAIAKSGCSEHSFVGSCAEIDHYDRGVVSDSGNTRSVVSS